MNHDTFSLDIENSKILRSIWKNTFDKILEIKVSNKRVLNEMKAKIMEEEQKKIDEKYKKEYNAEYISNKIELSKQKNDANLNKMRKKNEYIDLIVDETLKKLIEFTKSQSERYKKLLKDLIVESMVKMLEPSLIVQVRKEDFSYVKSILVDCENTYSNLMKKETKREYSCKLIMDEEEYMNEDYGGVKVFSKDRKIILSNDLKSRLKLSKELQLPTIKNILFPKEEEE